MKSSLFHGIKGILPSIDSASQSKDSEPQVKIIKPSEAIDILSDERRRLALSYLANKPVDEPVPIRDIAEFIAAQENNCSIGELSYQERKRVYIALCQSPSKPLSIVAEFDSNQKTLTPTAELCALWKAYCVFKRSLPR